MGGTTEFLVAGVLLVVKAIGIWSSDSFHCFTDTGVRLTKLFSTTFGTYQPLAYLANTNDVSKATPGLTWGLASGAPSALRPGASWGFSFTISLLLLYGMSQS
jgi:hypothetical protein